MSVPGIEQVGGRPFDELVQTASQQAVVLARQQVDVARRELVARARTAGPGVAMVGGGALLGTLASATATAALILLLARRPGASAAALGVTGAYAAAGAFLTREGLARLREAGPSIPDVSGEDEPVQSVEQVRTAAKRRRTSAAKSARNIKSAAKPPDRIRSAAKPPDSIKPAAKPARAVKSATKAPRAIKSAAKSPAQPKGRPKSESKKAAPRRRASAAPTAGTRRRAT
jgi:Putative Actinobacterial Holin-X, holin superfamily III